MATEADLRYLIEVNDRDLKEAKKNLDTLHRALGKDTVQASSKGASGLAKFDSAGKKTGKTLGLLGKASKIAVVGLGALAIGAAGAGAKVVGLASDAAEVDSKMNVVFGRNLPKLKKDLDAFSAATGTSRYELRQQAADMGALLKPLVGGSKGAADMSSQFVKLATDLGSFNNVPTAEALGAIRSGLIGEAEPLRRFGVLLSAGAVEAEAYARGIAKQGAELTEQQKVMARASLIMKQTTLAQGDATRTADGMANQMKRLRANVTDAATSIGVALIPYALKAVQAFNQHWPTIQRVAGQVFQAIKTGWERYAKPAISAIATATQFLVGQAQKHWPAIRHAAEVVVKWYKTNLEPTITSVVNTISRLWDRFGGQITAVAKAAFGIMTTIIGGALRTAKAVIDTFLAVLRGDWGKAWEGIKTIVSTVLATLGSVARQALTKLLPAMLGLGRDIMGGIASGLRDAGARLVRAAVEELAESIPGWARKILGISSPSLVMALRVGVPVSEGVAKGILSGKVKVTDAMEALVAAAVDRAQGTLQSRLGRFQAFAGQAFNMRQGGAQTATEKKIAGLESGREKARLERAVKDAATNLERVRKDAEATPEDVAAAQEALNDAKYDVLMAGLQKQAQAERANLEQRQFVEQLNFDRRMAGLQAYLESGHATTKGATERITDLLADFNITVGDMGELAGKLFAQGLRASIPGVVDASKAMTDAARNQQVVAKGAANAEQRAAAAKAAAAKAKKKSGDPGGTAAAAISGLGGGSDLVSLGRALQGQGFQVWEHPAFGGVNGRHSPNSYHYRGRAIDVNWPGGGATELAKLQGVVGAISGRGWAELLLEDAGKQNQHLHVALERGGILPGAMLGDRGAAGRRREAVLPLDSRYGQQQLADALAAALERAGASAPLVNVEHMSVRDDGDVGRVASAVNRAWGIR